MSKDFIEKCEKLTIDKGDIIIYRLKSNLSLKLIDSLDRMMERHRIEKGWAPQILLLQEDKGESLETMPEEKMNQMGWYRMQKSRPVTKCPACESVHDTDKYDAHLQSPEHLKRLEDIAGGMLVRGEATAIQKDDGKVVEVKEDASG